MSMESVQGKCSLRKYFSVETQGEEAEWLYQYCKTVTLNQKIIFSLLHVNALHLTNFQTASGAGTLRPLHANSHFTFIIAGTHWLQLKCKSVTNNWKEGKILFHLDLCSQRSEAFCRLFVLWCLYSGNSKFKSHSQRTNRLKRSQKSRNVTSVATDVVAFISAEPCEDWASFSWLFLIPFLVDVKHTQTYTNWPEIMWYCQHTNHTGMLRVAPPFI